MNKIRIVVADDHALFRHGMKSLILEESDMAIAGEAASPEETIFITQQTQPDVVLLDMELAASENFETLRQLRREAPNSKILVLGLDPQDAALDECMRSGAVGCILKASPSAHLILAVRDVTGTGNKNPAPLLPAVMPDGQGEIPSRPGLTRRETEILRFIAEGNSVKQTAAILGLSAKTVEAHKFNLMRKLNIHSKALLIQYAIQEGIIQH